MADRITLFISRDGAQRAAHAATLGGNLSDYRITPATLKDEDTGHIDRGFKVTLLNRAGHPVASL
ncbi:hypothetical protein X747_14425 [Mesorhizobium sp. LNJC384A00]|uniref:hypothetical protein n=1 Tax=Mesorhizobium sp. LNJC384A00 TaxID=1287268 RepID=UPI0003CF514D|nr:hypothetical protein [Mesorhizobium sp. LNJC384A00]ESY42001.1 hypothetical protein X747_14425 [Mesorhizobium sp. LNJC384A00]